MTGTARFTLISHILCPYVQRAVITLKELSVPYKRIDINLADKPEWFLALSPLGKVPLLVVDDETVLFESEVICEYLNEVNRGGLLAEDPLEKAEQRAWIEFASSILCIIVKLYNAEDKTAFSQLVDKLEQMGQSLEDNLVQAEYFSSNEFSLVDAAFAPAFRYLPLFKSLGKIQFFHHLPKLALWAQYLLSRTSVIEAVNEHYQQQLMAFLAKRESYLGHLAATAMNSGTVPPEKINKDKAVVQRT
ncbi:glutathione S-transferase family protein [Thalassomonas haliotis]|uniref:glutathione transferase n=1 Tax=Thalassomonas haliotis TaxID=485448 RepID=A0ABY7VCI1_9GAMM|nr:glutathione S-transferase family protein [Thalassomonas haliotis]WDE11324.1 glutathione S-transferase family protein [Thalassomonas haliotis]